MAQFENRSCGDFKISFSIGQLTLSTKQKITRRLNPNICHRLTSSSSICLRCGRSFDQQAEGNIDIVLLHNPAQSRACRRPAGLQACRPSPRQINNKLQCVCAENKIDQTVNKNNFNLLFSFEGAHS